MDGAKSNAQTGGTCVRVLHPAVVAAEQEAVRRLAAEPPRPPEDPAVSGGTYRDVLDAEEQDRERDEFQGPDW